MNQTPIQPPEEKKEDNSSFSILTTPQNLSRDILLLASISGGIVVVDQLTKSWVRANIPFMGTWLPENLSNLSPYARIIHWFNTGAAFGMFENGRIIFTILAIVASLFIIFFFPRIERKEWYLRTAMLFQLGGALGNLVDRLTIGHVTDFISVGNFPVFNIADTSISIGGAVLVIGVILQEIKERKNAASSKSNQINEETEELLP